MIMKQIIPFAATLMLAAAPASADQNDAPSSPPPSEEELQELGDLAQRWMRGFAEKMSPMVEQLRDMVDDLNAYEAPEMLPNGDIIIRRKPETPVEDPENPSVAL